MKIIINDTNIFIDMYSVGLMECMCELPFEIHTVDFVAAELTDPGQKRSFEDLVISGRIVVDEFDSEEMQEIVAEHSVVSGNLSIPDCAVCYFARKHRVPMLTGDRRLRRYAEQQAIEVHGILFLFDEMVGASVIPAFLAAEKLEELMRLNSRLPRNEISTRINKWKISCSRSAKDK